MRKFDTPAPISVVLGITAGRVQFIAADRVDTTVEVLPADPSKSRDVKTAEQATIAYADNVLRIHTPEPENRLFGTSGSLEVTIQLPADSGIEVKAARSEFRGVGCFGDVVFNGAQCQIKVDEAASVRLTVIDGDVEVGRLNGPAEISLTQGGIRVAEAVRGTIVLRTRSGDIEVNAAAGVSAILDAGSTFGRIHNALTNTEGASAQLNIHATTDYGNISARSL